MSSEYLNFSTNLDTTKNNLVAQGAVVIVKEVNESIKQLARAYSNKTGKVFTLVESYKNEYDIFDELIPRVKHLSYKNAYGAWPEDKAVDLVENDLVDETSTYEDAKGAIEATLRSRFKPPLQEYQTTKGFPNTALYKEIPQKFTDVRQTGRYVKITSQAVSANLDWFITNACLYGFIVYGTDALYYVGKNYLESIVSDQEAHTRVLYAFIPNKVVALPTTQPTTQPILTVATANITPATYANANTQGTGKPYANNTKISALRNEIVKFALECSNAQTRVQTIPFVYGFVDKNNETPGTPSSPTTPFEKAIKSVGFSRSPWIQGLRDGYWNGDFANPLVYINIGPANPKLNQPDSVPIKQNNTGIVRTLLPSQTITNLKKDNKNKVYAEAAIGTTVKLFSPQHYCNYTTNAFWLEGYRRYVKDPNFKWSDFKNKLGWTPTGGVPTTTVNAVNSNSGKMYNNQFAYFNTLPFKNIPNSTPNITDIEPGDMISYGTHINLCTEVDFLNSTIKTIGGNENANQFVTAGSKGATGNGVYEKTVKYPFKGYVALIKLPTSLL